MPQLTFKDGFFRLFLPPSFATMISFGDLWTKEAGTFEMVYRTNNFYAAKRYEKYADEKARGVLERAFVKRYELPKDFKLPTYLDFHQRRGVEWILTRARSYLAHAPGAGKTCEAITAFQCLPAGTNMVVVCPSSLTLNWKREIEKWGRTNLIAILPESKRQDSTDWFAHYLIVPDSMLAKSWVLENLREKNIDFLAVDEASRFKEPKADRSLALYGGRMKNGYVAHGLIYKTKHTVFMDGSPMPNRPMELWAPTYALYPEAIDFMSEVDFGHRYCGSRYTERGYWEFKGSSNEIELKERLQKDFMHVITEDELKHPERRRSLLYITKDKRSLAFKKWEKRALSQIKLEDIDEDASQGDLSALRQNLGILKISFIAKYISERLKEKNESILLFAWHRDVIWQLSEKLEGIRHGIVMGDTPPTYREKYFKLFNEKKMRLIIGNIAAMGRGHNLQTANRVVFGEYSWTDELNKQCEKRASRRGSEHSMVRCEYVVMPDSLDEIILKAVMRKESIIKKVIG